ncbi:TonB-dependent receptor [Stenotrophomonas sp. ZAC14D1_NAIMI4_6]|uniref:TonB-dependent receptor n=1 Tax=unclassified Stenotrophomonas maltophilia group TaxID=2961925 RepID=UPI000D54052D|nr:TonB-dependent receptor [Stenotrophomonas sp. ZAC14D1_NAIMI4_6]AWH37555.1 TonB-dependent receptor [Stenotrophomonas sp. ZAC14D1_NAIMI4_6]AWH41689.1 TonB-dependent receptor [Stenotrophomonas sp. ZAC14D1_NAIMI4_1]
MLYHRPLVLALSLACAGALPLLPAPARAQAATRHYDLPAQPLAQALDAYSRLTGVDLVMATALPAGHVAPALQGDFDDAQALTRLLAGSPLRPRFIDARHATLEPAPPQRDDGSRRTGPLRVQSDTSRGPAAGAGTSQYVAPLADGFTPKVGSERVAMAERQDGNSLLRSMPGSHSFHSRSQPGLQVNIRGMTGAGRVNTMIDGVTQTFRNNAGHGSGGPFAYVDPFLLAGVDVQRGAVAGADGAGTLAGSANFRTLDIDDLLAEGRDWGLRAGYRHGNNGYGDGRTFAGAWRHSEDGGDRQFGLLAAASSSRSGEYATANGQKNSADPASQQPSSWLLKARLQPSDQHRLDLSHMHYENDFYHNYPWQISARNQRASYHYTPYTPWLDVRVTFAGNKTHLYYPPVEDSSYIGRRTHSSLSSWTADNTSRFEIGPVQARWNTGVKHQSDIFVADTPTLRGANPQGRSQLDSVFSTLELQHDRYALTAGLRQERYGISGHIPVCSDVPGQCADIGGGDIDVRRTQHALSPSLAFSVQATDWLQLFVEASRTSRAPRVQEMFFEKIPLEGMSDADGVGANPFLRRERSRNLQFGANLSTDSLLVDGDLAQLRVTRFDNRIRDYIKPQYLLVVHPPEVAPLVVAIDSDEQLSAWTDVLDADDFTTTTRWMNQPGIVRMRGIELEAHYASEHYHATLSWTRSHTSAPTIEYVNLEDITALPDRYWTLDVGGSWWQQRVQAGVRAEYSGPTEEGYDFFQTRKTGGTGVLLDFYASFKPQANTTLWLNIENLQNKAYDNNASIDSIFSPILDRGNGRGRTVSMGINVAF